MGQRCACSLRGSPAGNRIEPRPAVRKMSWANEKKSKQQNKAAFVRSLSALMPQEIVKRAKRAGIKLNVGYVYNVRGEAKAKAKRAAKAPIAPRRASAARSTTGLRAAIEASVKRFAREILDHVRAASLGEILER